MTAPLGADRAEGWHQAGLKSARPPHPRVLDLSRGCEGGDALSQSPLRLVLNRPGSTRPRDTSSPPAASPNSSDEERIDPRTRDRVLIGIFVFALLLIVSSVWLLDKLLEVGKIQDCAWQGRRNCAPIAAPPR